LRVAVHGAADFGERVKRWTRLARKACGICGNRIAVFGGIRWFVAVKTRVRTD
jgi:hypothetical protein